MCGRVFQIPDVAAVAVATATSAVLLESPDSRSSTPDELTPALAQQGHGRCGDNSPDDGVDAAITCTMAAAAGTNRSTSFGKLYPRHALLRNKYVN